VEKGSSSYKVDDLVVNSEGEYEGTMQMNASEGEYTLIAYYELKEWSDDTTSWDEADAANPSKAEDKEATATKTFKVISTTTTKKATLTPKKSVTSSSAKKSKNAKTADETPILPLAGLCAASVLAGGLVVTRRRKRENE
ncbi:MAG: LPXTG cell wall anchor domain-containing protein, partial [Lachnospiraceae bacterium]